MINLPSHRVLGALVALLLPLLAACSGDETADTGSGAGAQGARAAAAFPADLFVAQAPDGAIGVREAITSAKAGEDIVVRGVVGGRKKVFVDGRAILVAIDPELKPCPDDEGCPTPWDYCCETQDVLLAHSMTVQVVGEDGNPLATSLEGAHGLDELSTIVVAGKVRNAEGTLVVDAHRIHVADG